MQRTQLIVPMSRYAYCYWRLVHMLLGVDNPAAAIENSILLCAAVVQHANNRALLLRRGDVVKCIDFDSDFERVLDQGIRGSSDVALYNPAKSNSRSSIIKLTVGLGPHTKKACETELSAAFGTTCLVTILRKCMALTEEIISHRNDDRKVTILTPKNIEIQYNTVGVQAIRPLPVMYKPSELRREFSGKRSIAP